MIVVRIDVKKLLKQHFYEGEKGTYCELVLMENRDGEDQYGNSHMVVQGVTKEDREAGVKGPIVGNAKIFGKRDSGQRRQESGRSNPRPNKGSFDPGSEGAVPF